MRLPFFYGWIIIAVTFVTMAIGVNARTAFSLFFPPIIDEFGWERGITAGAFSFGFVVSAVVSPLIGRLMDRLGPRSVMELGVALMAGGLLLAPEGTLEPTDREQPRAEQRAQLLACSWRGRHLLQEYGLNRDLELYLVEERAGGENRRDPALADAGGQRLLRHGVVQVHRHFAHEQGGEVNQSARH